MAKTKRAAAKKAVRLTAAVAARRNTGRGKTYRLVDGIPAEVKKDSAGRAILVSISRHRGATAMVIRKDMPAGFSDATLRFYLGKFQREKVVRAIEA